MPKSLQGPEMEHQGRIIRVRSVSSGIIRHSSGVLDHACWHHAWWVGLVWTRLVVTMTSIGPTRRKQAEILPRTERIAC